MFVNRQYSIALDKWGYQTDIFFLFHHENIYYRYCIYPKYLDTSTPYHTCFKIWTSTIYYLMLCLKIAEWVAKSVHPDEMLQACVSEYI